MNEEPQDAFIDIAFKSLRKLSECPELKNYRIYRDSEKGFSKKVQQRTTLLSDRSRTTTAKHHWSGKWILVVSAKRSARELSVKVRGCRHRLV